MNGTAPTRQLKPPPRVKKLVQEIVDKVHQDFGSKAQVIWFGSWVTGNAQPNSDIDLAISSPKPVSSQNFAMLRQWADDLPTLFSIDLINLNEASSTIVNEIKHHGIIIK